MARLDYNEEDKAMEQEMRRKRKIVFSDKGLWRIFDDNDYVGSLCKTRNGKCWEFTINGQSRTYDNFSDARYFAYQF